MSGSGRGRGKSSKVIDLDNVPETLSKDSTQIITIMREEFNKIRAEISEMKNEFMQLCTEKNEEISSLKVEVSTLKTKISKLEQVVDDADAYERRDTVIVSGPGLPEFSRGENSCEVVREIIRENFHINVNSSDINTSHRIGAKPQNQAPDKRSLIIKFCRRDLKREIITASKRTKNGAVFVNENLTPARRTIFKTLRTMKREHPDLVKGVSVFEGRVFAYTKSVSGGPNARDRKHMINSFDILSEFCTEFVKKPLDNFLNSFQP